MRIRIAGKPSQSTNVLVEFRVAPSKLGPRDVGQTVGEIRVVERDRPGRGVPATNVTVSLGKVRECTPDTCRRAAGAVVRWLDDHGVRRAAVDVSTLEELTVDGATRALCEGLILGGFQFDRHKSRDGPSGVSTVELLIKRRSAAERREVDRAVAICNAVNLAREWGHEPPNVVNPVTLAKRIQTLSRRCGLSCMAYDEKQLRRMGAGALLSVGRASRTPPRLIVIKYPGASSGSRTKPVVLVGKAITFDTGGYSLKDRESIAGMKYDKCGGTAVVAVLQAVAALKIRIPVVGIIAAAENMISGRAYRPNDIVTTMNGRTVEVTNTDAEGRLVLADALTFAQKRFRPRAIIDVATLTGGVVVALGSVRAGLFSNDDGLAEALMNAGSRVYERLWRLPLDDDYFELIKGEDSDLKNAAGRAAHPIVGAIFLKQFVHDKIPWAHLDIAGTATCDKDQPYCRKGATGFGVRLLLDYLRHLEVRRS